MYIHSRFVVLFNVCTVLLLIFCTRRIDGFWLWGSNGEVDGKWSAWSDYTSCQLPTGKEIYPSRQRTRQCNNPARKGGGKPCKGQAIRKAPCSDCDSPLGVESKIIKDSQITASTFHAEFPARSARLNGPSAWCAKDLTGELFLQVDFESLTLVTAIATQGFYPDKKKLSLRLGSVSKYQITYSDDGIAFEVYENRQKDKVFNGNGNDLKTVLNTFDPQIAAKHIRIHPTAYIKFVCMKLELYGCRFKCGGYLPQTPGDLLAVSSKKEDVDCFWQAHLPKSKKINLDFIHFNLPCKYGQVDIRGNSPSYGGAQRLGHFCDNKFAPPPMESSSNKLWIRFLSNSSDHLIGFYGIYFPNCDTHLNSTEGTFNTPNYPQLYNHNTKCSWTITVPKGKAVMLKFLDFDIEEDPGCNNDYLIVSNSNSSVIGQYCNSNRPPRLVCSNGSRMWLVFKSDDALAMKGFLATYQTINANAPCIEPSSSIITPTPTMSIPTSSIAMNSSLISTIKPTATIMFMPTLIRNSSVGVLGTGTGPQRPGMGNEPSKKKDDDDEDTGLTTIIIISVFSFIVMCMIIASVIPSMIHGYDKRKREREWLAAADLALKKNGCVENEYEMQPIKAQETNKDEEEPNEDTPFLDPENPSVHEENGNLESSQVHDDGTFEKPNEAEKCVAEPIDDFPVECELEYDTTDLNLSANNSYEDVGSSFATEMAALMSNYDYISPSPKKEGEVPRESEEDLKSSSGTVVLGEDDNQNESQSKPTIEEEKDAEIKDHESAEPEDTDNSSKEDPPTEIDEEDEKLQRALCDLKATLLQIHSDSESTPDMENPETCTNSTASVRGSQDIQNIVTPTVEISPVWEKIDGRSSNPRNSAELEATNASNENSNTTEMPELEGNKDSGHCSSNSDYDHSSYVPEYSHGSISGTETCV